MAPLASPIKAPPARQYPRAPRLLLALLAFMVASPPPAAAQPTPQEYELLLRDQISILQELDRLDADIEQREGELEALQDQHQELAVALMALEVQFEQDSQQLVATRDLIRLRLAAALAAKRHSQLEVALDPESAVDRARRLRTIRHLITDDQTRVNAYRERLNRWRTERAVLHAQRAELAKLESEVNGVRTQLITERERRRGILERINEDRRYFEKAHQDAAKAHEALADRIRKLEMWQGKQLHFARHKGQFRLPMSFSKVVTPFGPRKHPKLGATIMNPGMEIASQSSTAVRAVYWGRVAYAGWLLGYGKTVILDHTEGFHTVYARLEKLTVTEGEVVESRQVLGTIGGSSALGTPNTLLFELRLRGEALDPTSWFQ